MPPINDLLKASAARLEAVSHNREQAWFEAEILLSFALKKNRAWLIGHSDQTASPAKQRLITSLIRRRTKHEPLAYLLGETTFHDRVFSTDKRALIPRLETEELVDHALTVVRDSDGLPFIWDVGTGSGAVAVTMKKEVPKADVLASDVSQPTLTLAKKNARRHQANVEFVKANLLDKTIQKKLTDSRAHSFLILANLPYLPMSDKKVLAPDVVHYEPSVALFTKDDGRALIEKLLEQLAAFLAKDGRPCRMLFEFDPPQAERLKRFAVRLFPEATVNVLKDGCGRERILDIYFPNPANT